MSLPGRDNGIYVLAALVAALGAYFAYRPPWKPDYWMGPSTGSPRAVFLLLGALVMLALLVVSWARLRGTRKRRVPAPARGGRLPAYSPGEDGEAWLPCNPARPTLVRQPFKYLVRAPYLTALVQALA